MQPMFARARGWFIRSFARRFLLVLPMDTAAQRIHQADHLAPRGWFFFHGQRKMFQLCLDQFAQRGFVVVGELVRD